MNLISDELNDCICRLFPNSGNLISDGCICRLFPNTGAFHVPPTILQCGRRDGVFRIFGAIPFYRTMNSSRNKGRRGGERPAPPTMHVHQPHVAELVSVSANGRTALTRTHVVDTQPSVPSYVQEDMATNAAVESWEFSYDLGDATLVGEVQAPDDDGILLTSKRKVYENSVCLLNPDSEGFKNLFDDFFQDYPMLTWAAHQDEYLDEMLRLEGRGYAAIYSKCGGCECPNPTFRCEHQACYGPSLFCRECIVARHAVLPTHWIQVGGNLVRYAMSDQHSGMEWCFL